MAKKIFLSGMTCVSCEVLIGDELKTAQGVGNVTVCHKKQIAEIEIKDGEKIDVDDIIGRIQNIGYQAAVTPEALIPVIKPKPSKSQWVYSFLIVGGIYLVYKYLKWIGILGLFDLNPSEMSYGVAILVGVVASLSTCLAVVGAVVLSFSAKYAGTGSFYQANVKPHVLFHAGRLGSFFLLGGLLGTVGGFFQISPTFIGAFTIIIGLVLAWLALNIIGVLPSMSTIGIRMPKKAVHLMNRFNNSKHPLAPAVVGAITFFLPCGFTQSMQLFAVSSGSFWVGGFTMLLFALGTLPVLFGLGVTTTKMTHLNTMVFKTTVGIIIFLFSLYTMSAGAAIFGFNTNFGSEKETAVAVDAGNVQQISMIVDYNGYTPSRFNLKKDVPVEWIVDVKQLSGCTNRIISRGFGIDVPLKSGKNLIKFTPTKSGNIGFSCWMGMVNGTFIVN